MSRSCSSQVGNRSDRQGTDEEPNMNAAVRIDPETGLKVFNTRAAKASEKITGKGYSVLTNQKLKELPEMPAGATFNAEEQAKYRTFKESRRGAADYMGMEGGVKKYLDD